MTKKAAFITGNYRNLLHEYGYSQKEIDEKLKNTWKQLFSADLLSSRRGSWLHARYRQ